MRRFILGLGAQKAGTTWLFRQLIKSEHYAHGFCKEYHLFDGLDAHLSPNAKDNARSRVSKYPVKDRKNFVDHYHQILLDFYRDQEAYFSYFDSILRGDNSFSADITPSYSGLSSSILRHIKSEFNKRDIQVKVVFLMREPITRLESAVKMELRRSGALRSTSPKEMVDYLCQRISSHQNNFRSNYQVICEKIDEVFDSDDVFYGFYESLFSESEVRRLKRFLDLSGVDFDISEVVNSSSRRFRYAKKDILKLRATVSDTYGFVSSRFNFDTTLWESKINDIIDD